MCSNGFVESILQADNASSTIEFHMAVAARVRLRVFDCLGREKSLILEGSMAAGVHRITWQAGDLPSGLYFAVLETAAHRSIRGMTLIR